MGHVELGWACLWRQWKLINVEKWDRTLFDWMGVNRKKEQRVDHSNNRHNIKVFHYFESSDPNKTKQFHLMSREIRFPQIFSHLLKKEVHKTQLVDLELFIIIIIIIYWRRSPFHSEWLCLWWTLLIPFLQRTFTILCLLCEDHDDSGGWCVGRRKTSEWVNTPRSFSSSWSFVSQEDHASIYIVLSQVSSCAICVCGRPHCVTGDSDGTWTGGLWVAQEGTDKLYEKRGEHLKDENN